MLEVERIPTGDRGKTDPDVSRDLVAAAINGDLDAFGRLYELRVNKVYRYSLTRLRNTQDAEDITGEIFAKVLENISSYQQTNSPFDAWLMKVARNSLVSFVRKRGREFPIIYGELGGEDPDDLSTMEDNAEKKLMGNDAVDALKRIPQSQKEVIFHRFFLKLSVEQTAKRLGKNVNNVKVLQSKGLDRIATLLRPQYEGVIPTKSRRTRLWVGNSQSDR